MNYLEQQTNYLYSLIIKDLCNKLQLELIFPALNDFE